MRFAVALTLTLLIASPSMAAAPHTVLYVTPKPEMRKPLAAQIVKAMNKAAQTAFGKSFITNLKPLGKAPGKQFSACGADLSCLAKLGGKIEADRVFFGRIAPGAGGGATLQILVVGVVSETIEQRLAIEVPNPREAEAVITGQFAALDSGEAPPVAEALPPTVAKGEGVDSANAMAFDNSEVATPPAPVAATEPPLVAPPPVELPLVAPPKKAPGLEARAEAPVKPHTWMLPTGAVAAALGLGGVGVGAYFGVHSESLRSSIHYGSGGTTQVAAQSIGSQANQAAVIADALFIGGGILAAVGISLLSGDLAR